MNQVIFAFENWIWDYLGVPLLVLLGLFLSVRSRFFQIRVFPKSISSFFQYLTVSSTGNGIHPLKAFFACLGGCVGVANIVGVCTAVQVGGPGALLWIWVTAVLGAIVKYSEVYLGVKFRRTLGGGNFQGGPMIFLERATSLSAVPILFAWLFLIYGVEIYQFNVICDALAFSFGINYYLVSFVTLCALLYVLKGGVHLVGEISGILIPAFVLTYLFMGAWVILIHYKEIPSVFSLIVYEAFSPSALVGGAIGGGIFVTLSQGMRRACYSSDIGIGYASIIHSESRAASPKKQASLVIFDVFIDTFLVCTMSIALILITGIWQEPIDPSLLVQFALSTAFPGMGYFMPFFLFCLGFSTITAYLAAGVKSAEYLFPVRGKKLFFVYATLSLGCSVFIDTAVAQSIMAIAGGVLLLLNGVGIFLLRKEISFSV